MGRFEPVSTQQSHEHDCPTDQLALLVEHRANVRDVKGLKCFITDWISIEE